MRRIGILLMFLISAGPFVTPNARAEDQDDIDYRQHIMKTMDEQMSAILQIVEHKAPADNIATHVQIVAVTAATAKSAFKPATVGGSAKPVVWENWADFSKRLDELVASTAALAKSANDGGVQATAAKLSTIKCKDCHDVYQEAQK
jgi:cytochrome c556